MAMVTSYEAVEKAFNTQINHWKSFEEYEQYWLQRISETSQETNWYTNRAGVELKLSPVWHVPPKLYEVWTEGYIATGHDAKAQLLGTAFANNFAQACDIVMCKRRLKYIEELHSTGSIVTHGTWSYTPGNLSSYGCEFYWNEELARKFYH